jgi:peptide/nickel transport system substrate-binding protein
VRSARSSKWATFGALAISFGLIAAACSDKKDEESVGGGTTAPATETTTAETAAETTAPDESGATTSAPSEGTTETTQAGGDSGSELEFPPNTLPQPEGEPVMGGRLVVAGEAEVGQPWTPANVACDSFCQMRIRTFFEPLAVTDQNLEVHGFLAESIEPNEDFTVWTFKLREGINFTDGTPFNADAAMENINRTFFGIIPAGAMKDIAKNPDNTVVMEKLDDYTFTIATGRNGNPAEPVSWPLMPYLLNSQIGMMASPTWLAAVDEDPSLATQPVGTGPFTVTEYLPGDRMTVVKNPDYWRQDEAGNQLPYLDEIEFRVIVDSQTRQAALESGEVDLIATSDPTVVGPLSENDSFVTLLQNVLTETAYVMLHLTKPQFQSKELRCALVQSIDKQDLIDVVYAGYPQPSNGPFTPGQDGYLEDTGLPEYDPDAARAAIEAWEAENGPLTINYSTTPTGTNKAAADYLQQKWSELGIDVTQTVVEQSQLINNALFGTPEFEAFGWRNHAGIFVDSQNFWWNGFASDAFGAETQDGALSLNFGRLNDPVINDLLDQVRSETDPATRKELAQEINRQFARECWILPTYQIEWGIHMDPSVQNIGYTPLVDGDGYMLDGAGFPGQVWLTSVWVEE